MVIWAGKRRPSAPRPDRRAAARVSGAPDRVAFIDVLAADGRIEASAADRARAAMRDQRGECLPLVLTELGIIAESDLVAALRDHASMPAAGGWTPGAPVRADVMPGPLCRRLRALPVAARTDGVEVAIVDPFDPELRDSIRYALGAGATFSLIGPSAFDRACREVFGEEAEAEDPDLETFDDDMDRLEDVARRAPIVRLANQLFRNAFESDATDIHVEPGENDLKVRYRVDGMLTRPATYPKSIHGGLSTRLKILAGLNIAERRLPQDGRLKMVDRGREVDVRVSALPTPHGESIVMRLLGRSLASSGFSGLGLAPDEIAAIRGMVARPNGLFLVTGPTGSGKTTTLYAALDSVNDPATKIITVEDPIEYRMTGVTQVQAHSSIGLDFASALRSILRQDPDVVMIGEIRDAETARIAVQAALTGHLVLSTLHTNSAAATVTRLLNMGLEPYLVAAVVNGVLAQRLLRGLCPHCRRSEPASPAERRIVESFRPDLSCEPVLLGRAVGCPDCGGTGYKGRVVVAEIMQFDRDMRSALADGAPEAELEASAIARGMRTLAAAGVERALRLETTIEEVVRHLDVGDAAADPAGDAL